MSNSTLKWCLDKSGNGVKSELDSKDENFDKEANRV